MFGFLFLSKTGLFRSKIRLFKPALSVMAGMNRNFFRQLVAD